MVEPVERQRAVTRPGDRRRYVDAVPEPTLGLVLLLGSAVLVGAVVQGSVGFGIVVVAAPFVVWAAPELMPGSMLVCGFVMPLLHLTRRWRDIDWATSPRRSPAGSPSRRWGCGWWRCPARG